MLKKIRNRKGIIIAPDADALEGIEGEIKVGSISKKIETTLDGVAREILTDSQPATVTNKTLTSPVINTGVSGTAIDTDPALAADSDTLLASQKAVKAYIDSAVGAQDEASEISVVPVGTIVATNVQAAIQELDSDIQGHINDSADAHDASAISNIPAGTIAATDVQAAINELDGDVVAAQGDATQALADAGAAQSDITNHISDTVDAHDASAISNIPSGNLAATEVQAALNELQSDIDTRATSAALGAHTGASTGVHGVVGSVVGTSDSQVLTNKTITGADIRTPVRSDVKQDTKANLVTYAITASNGQLAFATDTKEMFQVVDGLLESVGGGAGIGGVDILFSQTFEEAAITDFTQTGLSLSTSNPLHGEISALMTHQAAVPQSFKQVVAVDEKFRGQSMILSLNTKSTATAGNVTISVYDETNAAAILASTQIEISSATAGVRDSVTFIIPATCLSMSYTVTALPQAASPVTRVDDILCQINYSSLLETSVTVPVITVQASSLRQIATIGLSSAVTGALTSNDNNGVFSYNSGTGVYTLLKDANVAVTATLRVGSTQVQAYIEINGSYVGALDFTSGAGASANAGWVGKLLKNETFKIINSSGAGSSDQQYVNVVATAYESSSVAIPLTQSGLVQESDYILRAQGNAGQAITSVVTDVPFISNSVRGNAGSWSGSQFTVAKDGIFNIKAAVYFTASASRFLALYVNGVYYRNIGDTITQNSHEGNISDYFTAGQVLSIRVGGSGTLLNDVGHWINITYQGSLRQVSINTNSKITIPTSELRFDGATTKGTGDGSTRVSFASIGLIRGDAFSTVTDTTGTLVTMNKAGLLVASATLQLSAAGTYTALICGNESQVDTVSSASGFATATLSKFVNIGDTIKVTSNGTLVGTSNTLKLTFQEQSIQVSVSNTLPQFSESDTSLRLSGANGFGSTATTTRRFASTVQNIGTDIEYIDSPTLGGQFIAKASGIYNVSYSENSTANQRDSGVFIRVNGTTVAYDNQIYNTATIDNKIASTSWSGYLTSGDIVTGVAVSTNNGIDAIFTMSKVGKPNVTGVDVTPFVNVPQPVSQTAYITGSGPISATTIKTAISQSTGTGLFSQNTTTGIFTMLKAARVNLTFSGNANTAAAVVVSITAGGKTAASTSPATSGLYASCSLTVDLQAGQTFTFDVGTNAVNSHQISIAATATSDSILTAPETFSTDTAALTYAGSGTYTLATLANAPVGTYITFTYAASGNVRTQTTVRPTQTDADMNANGMLIYTRAFNAASTAAQPAVIAIQIGKGLKGVTRDLYKSAGKVTAGSLDYTAIGSITEFGALYKEYNEVTGILLVDMAVNSNTTTTSKTIGYSDLTSQNSGYLVINASKSPSLVGVGIERVAARAVQSSAQSIPNSANTAITWDATKTYDTHGALNAATGVFTAPLTGFYQVNVDLMFASSSWTQGQYNALGIRKNGGLHSVANYFVPSTYTSFIVNRVSDVVYLNKGETVDAFIAHNRGSATSISADPTATHISIAKVSGIN
jgi:hypothetical protein